MRALLEIACFSPEDAVTAARAGAHRIELCRDYDAGGITPSLADLTLVKERVDIPVFVMIRERAGEFVYSDDEVDRMKSSVGELIANGADGVVFGSLGEDERVDEDALREMIDLVSPLPLTFHRAFDDARDPFEALDTLIRCGVSRLLTSGGQPTAMEGSELIARLIDHAGSDVTVIPGGGVRSNNIQDLIMRTGAREVHSAARTTEAKVDSLEVRRLVSELA